MPDCPGCGLANCTGMCAHCSGNQEAYERELAPFFGSSLADDPRVSWECSTCGLLANQPGACAYCAARASEPVPEPHDGRLFR